ncbi:MAG: DnaJ domain-containing protein [Haloarcula sp.]
MEATFYGVLGVTPDADEETIVRAYREQSKTKHPDVSDDPDAAERFKQLTVAKDVLTDDTERARYDRLGHETYVRRHVRGRSGDEGTVTSDGSDIAQQYVGQRATATGHTGASAATGQQPHQTRGEKSSYGTAADYYKPQSITLG